MRVGRDGVLRLAFERRGERTVLTGRQFRLPLQALEPVDLDGSGTAVLSLLNPTGGLLGGDVLDTRVSLGPGSRVCLTTPSATRVYRAAAGAAVQRFTATVAAGAALEHVPDHLIPSPGARLVQRTDVTLQRGAAAILVEAWAVGRVERGERWRFALLDLATLVRDDRGVLLKERAILAGEPGWERLGGAEGCSYVASLVAAAPGRPGWTELARALVAAAAPIEGARCGVTPLARDGCLARVLAVGAPALRRCLDALWAGCRLALLGAPPLDLRKL